MLHYRKKEDRGKNIGLLYIITQETKTSSSEVLPECGYHSGGQ